MTLTAQFQGKDYDGFHSYTVTRSVENLCGSFELSFNSENPKDPRFYPGDLIVIKVNKIPILTGYIDKRVISYGDADHTITISGRDKVADFVDSTVGSNIELKAPITLSQIVQTVMKEIKLTGVPIHIVAKNVDSFQEGEIVSGQVDETLFAFLEKFTRQRQVLMTTDGKGGFVLAQSGNKKAPVALLHQIKTPEGNNIKDASMEYDDNDRFYEYRVWSQGNPSAANKLGVTTSHKISNRVGIAYDKEIRHTRILDKTAEKSTDVAILKKRAQWEAKIRKARSQTYEVTVQDHAMTHGGAPWEPNMLVLVIDDYAPINDLLLIKSVEYTLNIENGTETKLQLVDKDSYLPEPIIKHKHGKKGRKLEKKYSESDLQAYAEIIRKKVAKDLPGA